MQKETDNNKLLNYNTTKYYLIAASSYLVMYEMLIKEIIEEIKHFYLPLNENNCTKLMKDSYNNEVNGIITQKKYNISDEIINKYKGDKIINSSYWYVINKAINHNDFLNIILFKEHRNKVAHHLNDLLSINGFEIKIEYLTMMKDIFCKIRFYWVKNSYDYQYDDSNKIDDSVFLKNAKDSMFLFDYYLKIFNDELIQLKMHQTVESEFINRFNSI